MQKYFEILRNCPLFHAIDDTELTTMLSCLGARIEHFDRKYTVLPEGKPARHIGVVLSGAVQIVQNDFDGNRSILTEIPPSGVFGEAFACAGTVSMPVAVIASAPSEVMLIDCNRILHPCEHHCGFHGTLIYNLMTDLAEKTILFQQKIEILSKRTTRERLLTYLALFAAKTGSRSFEIPFDRQELADYLEVDRSGLSVEIGKLTKEGRIESSRNHFTLL